MSIRRIESAYAHCMGKEIGAMPMSVLIALAYCENELTGRCFPSVKTVAAMVHCNESTVKTSCKTLRLQKLISWQKGGFTESGNMANRYSFLFPIQKMKSKRSAYESVKETPAAPAPLAAPIPPTGVPTPPTGVRTPPTRGCAEPLPGVSTPPTGGAEDTLPGVCTTSPGGAQSTTNTEYNLNLKPNITSESKPVLEGLFEGIRLGKCQQLGNALPSVGSPSAPAQDDSPENISFQEGESLIGFAMKVCRSSNKEDVRTFTNIMLHREHNDVLEEILTFQSEIKAGEHDAARNLAAILTKRLMKLKSVC